MNPYFLKYKVKSRADLTPYPWVATILEEGREMDSLDTLIATMAGPTTLMGDGTRGLIFIL